MSYVRWMSTGAATLLLTVGCVKRMERITIAPDGRVTIAVTLEGRPNELENGDAIPTKEAGWDVKRTTKVEEQDGKKDETLVIHAEQSFAPGAPLPETFANPDDEDTELYVHFPTRVWFEKRGNDTYVHFKRVYTARAWNFVQYWEASIFDDDMKKLAQKPVEELTQDDRVKILRAFGSVEAHKQLELAAIALRRVAPEHAPDIWLHARQAMLDSYDHVNWAALASIHAGAEKDKGDQLLEDSMMWVHPEDDMTRRAAEENKNERFEREHKKIEADGRDALIRSLRDYAGFNRAKLDAFDREWTRARKQYDITGAVGGHAFEIRVHMPGEVVAHNATAVDDEGYKWEFSGEAFRDRPFELLISAKLPRK